MPDSDSRPTTSSHTPHPLGGESESRTDLYRFYDAANRLLYIGISLSAAHRASEHKKDKPWWPDVARMEVDHLPVGRRRAEEIERSAIVVERPLHNVTHNSSHDALSELETQS